MGKKKENKRRYTLTSEPEKGKAPWYGGTTYEEVVTHYYNCEDTIPREDPHDDLIERMMDYEGYTPILERMKGGQEIDGNRSEAENRDRY